MNKTTQQESEQIVNGIKVGQLFQTIDAIKDEPKIAQFNFRAQNKWVGGTENHTTVTDYYGACKTHTRSKPHYFVKDEPPVLLGNDKGANPVSRPTPVNVTLAK